MSGYVGIPARRSRDPIIEAIIENLELLTGARGGGAAFDDAVNAALTAYLASNPVISGGITSYFQPDEPPDTGALKFGDLWFDSNDGNNQYRWNGVTWVDIQDTAINTALSSANDADAKADGRTHTFYKATVPLNSDIPNNALDATDIISVGDLWVDTNDDNHLKRFNGSVWISLRDGTIGASINQQIFRQATAPDPIPDGVHENDWWFDTDDGNNVYIFDGIGWVDVADTDIDQALTDASNAYTLADAKVRVFYQNDPPTAIGEEDGDLWVDTNDGYKLQRRTAGSWAPIQDAAIGTAQTSANTAQTTADGKVKTFYQTSVPTSTSIGDLWVDTDDGNKLYRAAIVGADAIIGGEWESVRDATIAAAQATANDKVKTFAQTTAPTATSIGDLWIDTDDGNKLYRATAIGAANWVDARDTTIGVAQTTAASKVTTFYQTFAPTATAIGDLWIDTDDGNNLYRASAVGAANWVDIADSAIATAQSTASGAQTTANAKVVTFYQTTAPTATTVGDLWVDTDDSNRLYRASAVGAANWVSVQDGAIAVAQSTANAKVTTFYQASAPSALAVGDLWIDTDDGNNLYRAGAAGTGNWIDIADTAIATAQSTASGAQTTANLRVSTFYQTTAPTATAIGDLWVDTDDNNKLYRASATGAANWVNVQDGSIATAQATANARNTTFVQASAPTALAIGDLWIDNDDSNKLYRASATGAANWVLVRDGGIVAAQTSADGKNKTFVQTTAPTATAIGDLWVDSDDGNHLFRASAVGAANWVSMRDGTIATAQGAANSAQTTANSRITTFVQSSAPTALAIGDLWIDNDDENKLYRASATGAANWVLVRDGGIAVAQTTAASKSTTFYQASPPSALAIGDLWIDTDDGNNLYRASAVGTGNWVDIADSAIATAQTTANLRVSTFYQTTAPTATAIGDLWVDTDDNNKLYRASATGAANWVSVQDGSIAIAQTTAASKSTTFYQASPPSALAIGDLWVDTDDGNNLYRASAVGTGNWVDIADSAIATAQSAANSAQTTANLRVSTFYQTGAPTATAIGDLWVDIDDNNKLYRASAIGAANWVSVTDFSAQILLASVVETTGFNAVMNKRHPVNTTGGAFTMTLPAEPGLGDTVYFFDLKGTFYTNNLTVANNTKKIMGLEEDLICDVKNYSGGLMYVSVADGWVLI